MGGTIIHFTIVFVIVENLVLLTGQNYETDIHNLAVATGTKDRLKQTQNTMAEKQGFILSGVI